MKTFALCAVIGGLIGVAAAIATGYFPFGVVVAVFMTLILWGSLI